MNLLYLTVLFPLIGFLLLAFSRGRWSENLSATVNYQRAFSRFG